VEADSLSDPEPVDTVVSESAIRLSDRLVALRDADSGDWQVRTLDGAVLSTGSTRWREGAHRFPLTMPASVGESLHADLAVTGWACPLTGALLAVDVHRRDEEPFHDIELDFESLTAFNRKDQQS
jgi:N-methylhydantoinase B